VANCAGKMPDRSLIAANVDMYVHEKHVYEVAAVSDKGRVRTSNEDTFGHCAEAGIFVVCDGMGGAAAGEVASRITVDAMLECLCSPPSHPGDPGEDASRHAEKPQMLIDAVTVANRRVFAQSETDARLHGMGTTLVALAVNGKQAWVAHVGDSRCYIFRDRSLRQWTQDHSLVDEQVRLGQITREEAERSPLRNVITRAVGSQPSVAPELDEVLVQPGDVFLLCSDGLTREVADDQIAAILGDAGELEGGCRQLIDAANANGGRDNVTCMLVRVR